MANSASLDDSKRAVVTASEAGASDLYRRYGADAVHLAHLMTGEAALAEDVVHEAFVRLLARWRIRRDPQISRAYLMRAVINLSKNHKRRRWVEGRYLRSHQASAGVSSMPDVEGHDGLLQRLQKLPSRQRAAVVLRFCEDLPEREVADILGTSEKAVRSLVGRGLGGLRALAKGGQDE